MNQIFC